LDPENSAQYSGHNLVNWRTSWHINNNLSVSARVINLLDEDYAERADYSFGNYRYFVGEPRSVYISTSYRF